MWFGFGATLFGTTWFRIVGLVQVRFMQYFEKKEKMMFNQDQKKKRMSIAERAGLRNKTVRNPLQLALTVYFTIWLVYPTLWLLVDAGRISYLTNHCCIVVMDVLAKSMYGFALLKFQLLVDKSQVTFGELRVTLAELKEERQHEKKQMRKMIKEQDEAEMQQRMDANDYDDDDDISTKSKSNRHGMRESPSPSLSNLSQNQWASPYTGGFPSMPMPVMAGLDVPAGAQLPAINPGMAATMQPMPSPRSGGLPRDNWRSM